MCLAIQLLPTETHCDDKPMISLEYFWEKMKKVGMHHAFTKLFPINEQRHAHALLMADFE